MSRRLAVNPVLSRELRQRVRSRRASVVLTAYLSLLVVAVGLLVWSLQQSARGVDAPVTQGTGRTVFGTLLFLILGLVCFIVPGVAAGAVAGERERLTLVPLQVTLLTPGQVLRGKLLASLAFTTLLLVASLPLLAVAYVLGGVTVPQIAGGLFLVLASAAFVGVVSLWASTVLRRVQRATVVAYGLVGLLVLGTPVLYGVQVAATSRTRFAEGPTRDHRLESLLVLAPNPFLVTADALGSTTSGGGGSPFTPSQEVLRRRTNRRYGQDPDSIQFAGGSSSIGSALPVPAPLPGPFATVVPQAEFPTTTRLSAVPPVPQATTAAPIAVPPVAPPTTAIVGGVPATGPTRTTIAVPQAPEPQPAPSFPGAGTIVNGRFVGPGGGIAAGRFGVGVPDHGDFTDRGPIWAWTFGWWVLLGGGAYLHAVRRLRLPSTAGVRP